jgi:hypothetical protein
MKTLLTIALTLGFLTGCDSEGIREEPSRQGPVPDGGMGPISGGN